MMPKGVEHTAFGEYADDGTAVKIPMMPKGVEHGGTAGKAAGNITSEDSNDAERR